MKLMSRTVRSRVPELMSERTSSGRSHGQRLVSCDGVPACAVMRRVCRGQTGPVIAGRHGAGRRQTAGGLR